MGTGFFSGDYVAIRDAWVRKQIASLPVGGLILDAGSGMQPYRKDCAHLIYKAHDFGAYNGVGDGSGQQTEGWQYGKLDYVSDIWEIAAPSESFDAILCTEVFEHIPFPNETMKEFSRLLKPDGILLVTVPFASTVHMAPYFFYSGFHSEYFKYMANLLGLRIEEISLNGDKLTLAQLLLMSLEMAFTSKLLRAIFRLSAVPVILFTRIFRRRMNGMVLAEGALGLHVRAVKLPEVAAQV